MEPTTISHPVLKDDLPLRRSEVSFYLNEDFKEIGSARYR